MKTEYLDSRILIVRECNVFPVRSFAKYLNERSRSKNQRCKNEFTRLVTFYYIKKLTIWPGFSKVMRK
jgi:hypothetical protein